MNAPRPMNGYSLVEMMVVLALIGILVSAAAPSLQAYIARHSAERALDQVAADVALVRLLAVREGRPSVMSFTPDGYTLEVTQPDGTPDVKKTVTLTEGHPGVELIAQADLAFSSRGLLLGDAQTFVWIEKEQFRDSIFVSPAGRIYRGY